MHGDPDDQSDTDSELLKASVLLALLSESASALADADDTAKTFNTRTIATIIIASVAVAKLVNLDNLHTVLGIVGSHGLQWITLVRVSEVWPGLVVCVSLFVTLLTLHCLVTCRS
ncbi:hypothetical protein [Salinirubrum litoreum]|uniref:Uncharacterized protein n=1 Tax=Salinirubrum litoreum TaxID=1126234 RepID=A0ABD5RD08_9EURY|nr:hypothetical protein [Salinirubrum litoreum]